MPWYHPRVLWDFLKHLVLCSWGEFGEVVQPGQITSGLKPSSFVGYFRYNGIEDLKKLEVATRVLLKWKSTSILGCISRLPRHQALSKDVSVWSILRRQSAFHVLYLACFEGCMWCILQVLQSLTILCIDSNSWKNYLLKINQDWSCSISLSYVRKMIFEMNAMFSFVL